MKSLSDLLSGASGILKLPGVYDALSARIAARSGAQALYMSGFGIAGASFGLPDIGLLGPDQMAERVRAIAAAIAPLPLVADGDNGYGGPANVMQLIRAYEAAGAQCVQLEDQRSPKRCGHMEGKEVVPTADAVANIRAAASARSSKSFKIMARTDARQTHGLDEALRRSEAFLAAGADILFIEAPQSEHELQLIAERFRGAILVANQVEDGKTPLLPSSDLERLGFRIALYPISALLVVSRTLESVYSKLLASDKRSADERVSFGEFGDIVGLKDWQERARAAGE